MRFILVDSIGVERTIGSIFYAYNMPKPDLILGRPQQRTQYVRVDSATNKQLYSDKFKNIWVQEPYTFLKELKNTTIVYAIIVSKVGKEYQAIPTKFSQFNNVLNPTNTQRSNLVDSIEYTINLRPSTISLFQVLYY